jgi:hypothetical protein
MRNRATADGVTAPLARRLPRAACNQSHEDRRLCDRRATKRSDWRGGRAGPSTHRIQAVRLRAWRVAGVTIWHVRSARSEAQCSGAQRRARAARQFVKRAVGRDPATDPRPAIPGHGKGRLREHRRRRRPGRVARGIDARQDRDAKRLDAKTRKPGPAQRGRANQTEWIKTQFRRGALRLPTQPKRTTVYRRLRRGGTPTTSLSRFFAASPLRHAKARVFYLGSVFTDAASAHAPRAQLAQAASSRSWIQIADWPGTAENCGGWWRSPMATRPVQ